MSTAENMPIAAGGLVCGGASDCFKQRECIQDALFEGECPPLDWRYRTAPGDRVLVNVASVSHTHRLLRTANSAWRTVQKAIVFKLTS